MSIDVTIGGRYCSGGLCFVCFVWGESKKMDYNTTIRTLFEMLSDANMGDDVETRQWWQDSDDASERCGSFGHLRKALIAIAGEPIFYHWCETGEVETVLADRFRDEV